MKTSLYHVQLNVSDAGRSLPFYRALLEYFEYRPLVATRDILGMTNGTADFWLIATARERTKPVFHRKRTGLNHLAFGVEARAAVDVFHQQFLVAREIPTLYGPPRDHPEYAAGYYAVFFEDPDRLKLEVAYVPGRTGDAGRGGPARRLSRRGRRGGAGARRRRA